LDFSEYLYSSYLIFFSQKKSLVKICWLLIMNPTFMTCHTWAKRQGNDILTTSATMCKIRAHIFCTFGSMLLNKFKEDSKGLHKKETTNCHNHACVVPTKLMLEFESMKPLFFFLNAPILFKSYWNDFFDWVMAKCMHNQTTRKWENAIVSSNIIHYFVMKSPWLIINFGF
jgi:hypothetical protein